MSFYELDWIWTLDQVINLTRRTIVSKIEHLRVECLRHCACRDVPGTARNDGNHCRQLDAQDGPLPPNKNTCTLLSFTSDSKTAIHRWDHMILGLRKSQERSIRTCKLYSESSLSNKPPLTTIKEGLLFRLILIRKCLSSIHQSRGSTYSVTLYRWLLEPHSSL